MPYCDLIRKPRKNGVLSLCLKRPNGSGKDARPTTLPIRRIGMKDYAISVPCALSCLIRINAQADEPVKRQPRRARPAAGQTGGASRSLTEYTLTLLPRLLPCRPGIHRY